MEELLAMISRPSAREFFDRLMAPGHAEVCDTSCPDCLRSYSNLSYHSLLDWRLGVDMAALALDANAAISLSSPMWQQVANVAALTLAAARPGYTTTELAGLPAATNGADVISNFIGADTGMLLSVSGVEALSFPRRVPSGRSATGVQIPRQSRRGRARSRAASVSS